MLAKSFVLIFTILYEPCLGFRPSIKHLKNAHIKEELVIFGAGYDDDGINLPDDVVGLRRSTNGKVWGQYLAENLGLKVLNFALHGATSGVDNMFIPGWGGNQWQVDYYLKSNPTVKRNVLIGMASGAINEMFFMPHTEAVFNAMVKNITDLAEKLINAGATAMFILNLPDYTTTPASQNVSDAEKKDAQDAVAKHNEKMKAAIANLTSAHPGVTIIPIDFARYWMEALQKQAYQSAGFLLNDPFQPVPNYKEEDMTKFAYFDSAHPSSPVHYEFAKSIQKDIEAAGIVCH